MEKSIAAARTMTIVGAVPIVTVVAFGLLFAGAQAIGLHPPDLAGYSLFFFIPAAAILGALICIPSAIVWLVLEYIRAGRKQNRQDVER